MEKYYKFAGVELAVDVSEQWMYEDDRTLRHFRVEKVENAHHFTCAIAAELDGPEGRLKAAFPDYCVYEREEERIRYIGAVQNGWQAAYIRAAHRGREHQIQIKSSAFTNHIGAKTILKAIEAEHLIVEAGGVVLHASYIEWNGRAVLFTAPSGTGKSTQADLWREHRHARIINGDRAAVRVIDGKVLAAGIPFSGSSDYCENAELPVAAIVYLEQGPTNEIRPLTGMKAFRRIWEGCTINTWDENDLNKGIDLVENIVKRVPIYHFSCTPDEAAVIALEKMLAPENALMQGDTTDTGKCINAGEYNGAGNSPDSARKSDFGRNNRIVPRTTIKEVSI